MPVLSPFALALLGQLSPNDGTDQEPDQDADDFGKWAIADQAQRANLAKRKQVQQSKMAAEQGSLIDRLVQNSVDSRPQPAEPPNEFQSPKIFNPLGERVANPSNKAPIAAVLQQPSEESLLDSSLKVAGPQSLAGLIGRATGPQQNRPEGVEWLPRFAGTNAPPPKPLTPSRLNARGNAKVAANPYDTLDSTDPEQASLQDRLAGMTLVHPEAQNIPAKKAAKREANTQAQWNLEDKELDRKFAASRKSQGSSQNATQRNLVDALRGRTEASGKSRSDELYDDTMSEFRNRQTLAGRNAGMGNSAALYAGTPRYNAKLPGGSKPAVDEEAATQAEFDANKARMSDPTRKPGLYGLMAKKNAEPQNLSETTRSNIALSKENQEKRSLQAALGLREGREGVARPENATPKYDLARIVGLDQRMRQYGPDSIREQMIRLNNAGGKGDNQQGANIANADERAGKALAAIMVINTLQNQAKDLRNKGDEVGAKNAEAAALEAQATLARLNQAGQAPDNKPLPRMLGDALMEKKPKPVQADMQMFVKRQLKGQKGGPKSNVAPQNPDEWKDWFRQALTQ